MARLTTDKKAAVLGALVEGSSIRSVERMTGVGRNTIGKLVLQWGRASERLMDEHIRGFRCEQVECDEMWTFIGKRRNRVRSTDSPEVGDAWIWVGIDPDSKLVPAHYVGKRKLRDACEFTRRLRQRIEGDVQLNTDRLHAYRSAILGEFSTWNGESWDRPDWGTVVKRFEVEPAAEGRYTPPRVVSVDKRSESGNPYFDRMTTSHVENQNLHFRMRNKRAARLSNAHSKSLPHLRAATATYYAHYNFVRKHSTIKTTPAVVAGVAGQPWKLAEFVEWGEMYGRG